MIDETLGASLAEQIRNLSKTETVSQSVRLSLAPGEDHQQTLIGMRQSINSTLTRIRKKLPSREFVSDSGMFFTNDCSAVILSVAVTRLD